MTNQFSIAKKIFGLALIILCLNIIPAAMFLHHISKLRQEMQLIAKRGVPLAKSVSDINFYGLQQRLAFEQWYGALIADPPNPQIIDQARENYTRFTEKLSAECPSLRKLLDIQVAHDRHRQHLDEIRLLLDQIEPVSSVIFDRQKEVLELQTAGQRQRAGDVLRVLNDLQSATQRQRTEIQGKIAELSGSTAQTAAFREQWVIWLSILIILFGGILGLALAAFITRRIVKPVHSLVNGLHIVEKGNLDLQLPVVSRDEIGVLTQSFNFFTRELRSKEQIKQLFGKYVDPRILDQVILRPDSTAIGRRTMTVSFADLVGFSAISEQLTPAGMVNLLNRHFTLQAQAVQQHLGVIDKFMGDAIMAFWGPPFTAEENHSLLACRAALEQLRAMETLRSELSDLTGLRKNLPNFDLRIGISAGEVVVGNIGAENARSYTIIGDTVNLGQRLEQANRIYGTRILLSESAALSAGSDIVTREIDLLVPKGKTEAIRVFELLGWKDRIPDDILRLCQSFASALAAYRTRNWDQAESFLQECLQIAPQDGPSRLFLTRLRHLRTNPPDDSWQGISFLDSK